MAVTNPNTQALSDADREAVEAMLLSFEQSWQEGALAGFAARLPEAGPVRFAALVEAVKVDLERSWQAGRRPEVEEYLRAYPELGTPADTPTDLLQAELEARRAAGDTLPLSALLARFPDRAAELRRLVGTDVSTVETPNLGAAASTATPFGPVGEAPQPLPEQVGPYRVVRRLGGGGMGSVYLAQDTRLDRPVALKVPRLSGLGPGAAERFRREGRAAAALRHPNICPVFDVGEVGGTPFLAMAYLDGQTLAERVKAGRLPAAEAATLARKLARALAVAHKAGVIHRDLKPANIMVGPDGEPVVMDFGLARLGDGEADRLTGTGDVLGTPAYMAPEQVDRTAGPVGPATDVYGLGAVLYELLTGRPPFTGTLSETLWQIGCRDPERPSALRPDLDPQLEEIVMKAMAKRPTDRYPAMDAFAGALDDYLAAPTALVNRVARHLPAAPPPVAEPASRRPRRGRWRMAVVAGVLLLAGAGAVLILSGQRRGNTGGPPNGDHQETKAAAGAGDEPVEDRATPQPMGEPKYRVTIGPTERSGWYGTRFWVVSSDDHTLAYADRNSETVELWDAKTGKKVASLPGHSRDVARMAFSPDGKRLAVASLRQIKVWDVKAAKELFTSLEHERPVEVLGFSANGKRLVSLDSRGKAVATDADTGQTLQTAEVKSPGDGMVRWSPDKKTFAVLRGPLNNNTLYDMATLEVKKSDFGGIVEDGMFTPDGKRIVVAENEDVKIFNLETGKTEAVHKLHTNTIKDLMVSPDGKLVATSGNDKVVIVWDLEAKAVRTKITGLAGPVRVVFSPDGNTLLTYAVPGISGKESRSLQRFDVASGKELSAVGDHEAGVFKAFFCQGGRTLAVQDMDGKVALYDVARETK
jgi:WD40 repeat protein/predicted Ser/Thr protein kinase